jgi:hypothetical protein
MKAFLIRDLLAAGRDPLTHELAGDDPGQNRRVNRLFASPATRPNLFPANPSLRNRSQ